MLSVFTWWFIAQILGWVAMPLAYRIFRWLPDRGYSFAKAVGLLLTSYLLWICASTHTARNDQGGIVLAMALAAVVSFGSYRHGRKDDPSSLPGFLRQHKLLILATEALFTLAFVVWGALRAYAPEKIMSTGGEKFMEIAFLNGVLNSRYFPPLDPWLSGFSISYYYFGYIMMALMAQLSGVSPSVGFELYDALLFALTMQGAFGVVYNLVAAETLYPSGLKAVKACIFGLLGALMVAVLGNLEGLLEAFYSRGLLSARFWQWLAIPDLISNGTVRGTWYPGSSGNWWWWRASRVIQDRDLLYRPIDASPITEFPFFSFLLGDNHPHVLALPFVVLAMAMALNLLRKQMSPHTQQSANGNPQSTNRRLTWWKLITLTLDGDKTLFLCTALFLGALGFLNTWDMPIHLSLTVAGYAVGLYTHQRRIDRKWFSQVAVFGVSLSLSMLLLYAFFFFSFRSQAGGLLPYIFPPTRLSHYLVMFGTFVFILASFLIGDLAEQARQVSGKTVLKSVLKWWVGIMLASTAFFALILAAVSMSGMARQFIETMRSDPASPLGGLDLNGLLRAILFSRWRDPWLFLLLSALLALGVSGLIRRLQSLSGAESARSENSSSRLFVLLLILFALLLTFSVEFVYLRDNFGVRMNTIFKFYYQAWVMMGCASAYALWWWLDRSGDTIHLTGKRGILAGSALLILAGMVYPAMAYRTRVHDFRTEPNLDGAAFIAQTHPDDWAAIQWLRQNVVRQFAEPLTIEAMPVLLEAPGKSYDYEGRISAFTGIPAILGWSLHEGQWRGSYEEQSRREPDIAVIYSTPEGHLALELLKKWKVHYVIVGSPERQYVQRLCNEANRSCNPARALAKFDSILETVFSRGETKIYRVP